MLREKKTLFIPKMFTKRLLKLYYLVMVTYCALVKESRSFMKINIKFATVVDLNKCLNQI